MPHLDENYELYAATAHKFFISQLKSRLFSLICCTLRPFKCFHFVIVDIKIVFTRHHSSRRSWARCLLTLNDSENFFFTKSIHYMKCGKWAVFAMYVEDRLGPDVFNH